MQIRGAVLLLLCLVATSAHSESEKDVLADPRLLESSVMEIASMERQELDVFRDYIANCVLLLTEIGNFHCRRAARLYSLQFGEESAVGKLVSARNGILAKRNMKQQLESVTGAGDRSEGKDPEAAKRAAELFVISVRIRERWRTAVQDRYRVLRSSP